MTQMHGTYRLPAFSIIYGLENAGEKQGRKGNGLSPNSLNENPPHLPMHRQRLSLPEYRQTFIGRTQSLGILNWLGI